MASAFDIYLENSPALQLLRSPLAGFMLEFFQTMFKAGEAVVVVDDDLEAALEERLREHRQEDPGSLARGARHYLNTWCDEDHRYLRRRFSEEHQAYVYQLTRHSEKALAWMEDLRRGDQRGYATSDSRFTRIVNELRRVERETDEDPEARIRDLLEQRDSLDAEIKEIRQTGKVNTLDPQAVKDALVDLESMIRDFLSDFRAIEENFREQAREIQLMHVERQLTKGDMVEHVLNADEALRNRDQGRSYFGFRQAIVPVQNREELQKLAVRAAELAGEHDVDAGVFDNLVRRLYEEVASVQTSYRRISAQLRRVVEEQNAQQTRYLLEMLGDVRRLAHRSAATPPEEPLFYWDEPLRINNLMETAFWEPPARGIFSRLETEAKADDSWKDVLARIGKPLDLDRYRRRVDEELRERTQVSLVELVERRPLENGAVDLVAYLAVVGERPGTMTGPDSVTIDLNRPGHPRYAELEQVIFIR